MVWVFRVFVVGWILEGALWGGEGEVLALAVGNGPQPSWFGLVFSSFVLSFLRCFQAK